MNIETYAAIDIGSNAVRFMVKNIDKDLKEPDYKKAAFLRVPIRLGEDVFTTGRISKEKKDLLLDAMTGFTYLMKAYKVKSYKAVATSAMRDARNGKEIVKAILTTCNIKIEIISGKEEADIIYEAGGLDKVMDKNRNYLYVDVGGGSTEIVIYSDENKLDSASFQLGTVRMLADKIDEQEVKRFKEWLRSIYKQYAPLSIIASGGNINKIHKILGKTEMQPLNYPETKVLYDTLKEMTYEERIRNYKLNTYRADVILPALRIFLTVSKICKTNEMYVPKLGVVDGLIHHIVTESQKENE